ACQSNPVVVRCASTNCNALAACLINATCNAPILDGNGTCNQALSCELSQCKLSDNACGCRCAKGMSPTHALALFFADACLVACNNNQTCVQQQCLGYITACGTQ